MCCRPVDIEAELHNILLRYGHPSDESVTVDILVKYWLYPKERAEVEKNLRSELNDRTFYSCEACLGNSVPAAMEAEARQMVEGSAEPTKKKRRRLHKKSERKLSSKFIDGEAVRSTHEERRAEYAAAAEENDFFEDNPAQDSFASTDVQGEKEYWVDEGYDGMGERNMISQGLIDTTHAVQTAAMLRLDPDYLNNLLAVAKGNGAKESASSELRKAADAELRNYSSVRQQAIQMAEEAYKMLPQTAKRICVQEQSFRKLLVAATHGTGVELSLPEETEEGAKIRPPPCLLCGRHGRAELQLVTVHIHNALAKEAVSEQDAEDEAAEPAVYKLPFDIVGTNTMCLPHVLSFNVCEPSARFVQAMYYLARFQQIVGTRLIEWLEPLETKYFTDRANRNTGRRDITIVRDFVFSDAKSKVIEEMYRARMNCLHTVRVYTDMDGSGGDAPDDPNTYEAELRARRRTLTRNPQAFASAVRK